MRQDETKGQPYVSFRSLEIAQIMPVTLRDLARHLNLSHATVSFVLNDRRDVSIPQVTRDRVLVAAKELGYQPNRAAKALASGRTQMIALWTPTSFNSYYASILYHLQHLSRDAGYDIIYRQVVFDPERSDSNMRSLAWPVDAVLAVDAKYVLENVSAFTTLPHPPIVSIGAYTTPGFDSVTVDLYQGTMDALEHLASIGRKNIGFVRFVNPVDQDDPRANAYRDYCRSAGIEPNILEMPSAVRSVVRNEIRELGLAGKIPEALFCYNDHIAISTIRGLKEAGLQVPRDCAVVGCDGIDEADLIDPSLTTVSQPIKAMCGKGWEMMIDRIHQPEQSPRYENLRPELIIRESTSLG